MFLILVCRLTFVLPAISATDETALRARMASNAHSNAMTDYASLLVIRLHGKRAYVISNTPCIAVSVCVRMYV